MQRHILRFVAILVAAMALGASPVGAESVDITDPQVFLDNTFVLVCAALVILMQAGFAMIKTGLSRAKNAANTMLRNLLDFVVAATAFAFVGYHVAFSGASYIGFVWRWESPVEAAPFAPTLTVMTHFLFTMAVAAVAATIVSGAMAERAQFRTHFLYSGLVAGVLYPIVVGWQWGGGWLSQRAIPFVDFAGGTVVHVTGGTAALMGALILGPRIGRFNSDGKPTPIPGHNIPLATLGVLVLLFGWFGFNAGSALSADLSIGIVAAISAMGAAAGGVGAAASSWLNLRSVDVTLIGNGVIGGLVSISAGAPYLSVTSAFAVGLVGGVIATQGVLLLDRIRVDDPVGAVPVHLFAGMWGTLAVALFADPQATATGNGPVGLLFGGSSSLLIGQLVGIGSVFALVAVTSGIFFIFIKEIGWLRVTPEAEMAGLDVAEHANPAYNEDVVPFDDYLGNESLAFLLDGSPIPHHWSEAQAISTSEIPEVIPNTDTADVADAGVPDTDTADVADATVAGADTVDTADVADIAPDDADGIEPDTGTTGLGMSGISESPTIPQPLAVPDALKISPNQAPADTHSLGGLGYQEWLEASLADDTLTATASERLAYRVPDSQRVSAAQLLAEFGVVQDEPEEVGGDDIPAWETAHQIEALEIATDEADSDVNWQATEIAVTRLERPTPTPPLRQELEAPQSPLSKVHDLDQELADLGRGQHEPELQRVSTDSEGATRLADGAVPAAPQRPALFDWNDDADLGNGTPA